MFVTAVNFCAFIEVVDSRILLSRGGITNRTYGMHKNLFNHFY